MISGAIFDLDGTILDSMPIWYSAAERFLKGIGIEAEPGIDRAMFSMSTTEGAVFLKERYRLDLDTGQIIYGIDRTIEDFYAHQVQLKDGVEHFLQGMWEAGVKMVIATTTDRNVLEPALERLDVVRFFDRIFTTAEVGAGKTRPDIYFAAARHMGTLPEETWVFEDALYAIKTAKSAGFRTVGVYDPYSADDWEEIRRICDLYMEKMDDVHAFLERASS